MQSNTAVQFLPAVSNDQKIDVSIINETAIIKFSTFTEGLGWTCQKTLNLDSNLLNDLHHAISAARYRLNARQTENADANANSNIIAFPNVS